MFGRTRKFKGGTPRKEVPMRRFNADPDPDKPGEEQPDKKDGE